MLFSSMIFLWAFLPTVLILYWMAPSIRLKNIVLLVASLIFYAWGEPIYIFLMLFVVLINYVTALLSVRFGRVALIIGVTGNLMILGYFKYFNFLIGIVNSILRAEKIAPKEIVLPLGISFFTFQAMSYAIDVYRGNVKPCYNFFNVLLYVSLFPQLVAGPIVRYSEVAEEITNRVIDRDEVAYGIKRFCYGLGKKVILSNILAEYADIVFNAENGTFSGAVLWLGTLLYTLQIYYDFSGYSDIALGLCSIFGFTFKENFNYPYLSLSISEFWRRWHISLGTWFREYVYIPLGGNRRGNVYVHLLLVFILTGLWHGTGLQYLAWGLVHGLLILLERRLSNTLLYKRIPSLVKWLFTIIFVFFTWILFMSKDLTTALSTYQSMVVPMTTATVNFTWRYYLSNRILLFLVIAIAGHLFGVEKLKNKILLLLETDTGMVLKRLALILLFVVDILYVVNSTYSPFIYFQF